MNNANNKCITDSSIKRKLNKIKEFKQKIVSIKPEDLMKESTIKSPTGHKSKDKIENLFCSNHLQKSSKKHKLKLITRNQLVIYFDDLKNKKGNSLYPILEESKNGKNSFKSKSFRLSNIKQNKNMQINNIKIIQKEQKEEKIPIEIKIKENNKENELDIKEGKLTERKKEEKNQNYEIEEEKNQEHKKEEEKNEEHKKEEEKNDTIKSKEIKQDEKNKEKENDKVKEQKEEKEQKKEKENKEKEKSKEKKEEIKKEIEKKVENRYENEENKDKSKSDEMKKSFELKPIHLKGKHISLKASNNIAILKNVIRDNSEEKKNNDNLIIKSLNLSNNNNTKQKSPTKKEYKLQYCVYPGNNTPLIDKVMAHRYEEWEKVPTTFSEFCDLVWSPLSGSINFQNCEKRHQYANHIEFNIEISNKMRLFANLLRHCEEKKIDTFSIFPFTISLQLSHWSFSDQLNNFKKLYYNIDSFTPNGNKKFNEMFNVILSRKIGSMQYINIPQSFNSGKNLWIIKPINLNRGRYITVEKSLKNIIEKLEVIQEKKKININDKKKGNEIKCEYILIQKYLEKPLLYQGRKFDIRLWVLFIAEQDDDVYIFRQGHLKATCTKYDPDSSDLYVHLTNYSVQKYNQNFSKIEIGNEIPFKDFQKELDKNETGINFYKDIYPKIVRIVRITGGAAKGKMNFLNKKYCFEIFGYDFILDENYQPYLLEINTNPGLEISSPIIDELLPRMVDDALKLTIDKEFIKSMKYSDEESTFHVKDYDDKKNMWEKYSII